MTSTARKIVQNCGQTMLYETAIEPQWTKLPKPIKRQLSMLVGMSSNLIHDPRFYETLHSVWSERRKKQSPITIDCAICLDTFNLDGKDKVTTLLCGHSFCTSCMLNHMNCYHLNGPSCPMCRSSIFDSLHSNISRSVTDDTEQNRKRLKRQRERWLRRQKKKQR